MTNRRKLFSTEPNTLAGARFIYETPPTRVTESAEAMSATVEAPGSGAQAPEVDTARIVSRLETLTTAGDIEELITEMHVAIANRPVTLLLDALESRAGYAARERIMTALVPKCMESLRKYVHVIDPNCEVFAGFLNVNERFYLSMLYAKDPRAAEHSLDVYILTHQALAMPEFKDFTLDQRAASLRAALLHDIGKLGVPNIVMNNPLQRNDAKGVNEQRDAYGYYLKSTDRGKAGLPGGLKYDDEQGARFEKLLKTPGDLSDAERGKIADEIIELCKAQNVHDFRFVLPTRDLLRYSSKMAASGRGTDRTWEQLKTQEADLSKSDQIMAMYEIPQGESFADTAARHEMWSQKLLERTMKGEAPAEFVRVLDIISTHHDNPITRAYRDHSDVTRSSPIRPEDKKACHLLRIADIMAALSSPGLSERSYAERRSPTDVRKILLGNADRGYTDSALTRAIIEHFIEPQLVKKPEDVGALNARVFERLKVECADMDELTLAQLSDIQPGKTSAEQSSAILAISEAVFLETKNRERAREVRLYLEQGLGFVALLMRKVLQNQGDDFAAILKSISEAAQPNMSKNEKTETGTMQSVRLFDYLHHELKDGDFVQNLAKSGETDVDETGFPKGTGKFAPALLKQAVDSIMSGLEFFAPKGSESKLRLFRQYLEKHQDMVLFILSSAKNDHFQECAIYLNRVEAAISKSTVVTAERDIEGDIANALAEKARSKEPETPQAFVGGA